MDAEFDRLVAEFSGVVSVTRGGDVLFEQAYGFAHRAYGVANTVDTRFGVASGTKGLTALTVVSLIAEGRLSLETPAREVLGKDLPLIGDDVTIEHLLAHRSGIGDYYDEQNEPSPGLPPESTIVTSADYLAAVDGYPPNFPAGQGFRYCNGGYVVLGLIAERVAGVPFTDLVRQRVCEPAGMVDTHFPRADALPERTATGYLADGRTNLLELPVVGHGDGGIHTTAADVRALWTALVTGRIVPAEWVTKMTTVHSELSGEQGGNGLGFWLPGGGRWRLQGGDPGVSFCTEHDPATGLTHTVLANVERGARDLSRWLAGHFLTKS